MISRQLLSRFNWFILLMFTVLPLHAQIAQFDFEKALTESISGYDPQFIILEDDTAATEANYTTGVTGHAVQLDREYGLKLPMAVTDALLGSNVWAFKMRFKVTDWASAEGDGQRMLINLKRENTGNTPFFQIRVSQKTGTTGNLAFSLKQPGATVSGGGITVTLDEWVDFTFVIDFEKESFSLYTDDYFNFQNFEGFDYEAFKTLYPSNNLSGQQFYVGYYQDLSWLHKHSDAGLSSQYPSNLIIDELTIYNTHLPTDASLFESALLQLTSHLNGEALLTDLEISTLTGQILTNFQGNYLATKSTVDTYLAVYESNYDPMFINGAADFYTSYDEFGWITLNLQIDLFDNYLTPENIDAIEGITFETHEIFPGPVAPAAVRLSDQVISISGTYVADPGYNIKTLDTNYGTFSRKGTGYYAAPGERITVTVPNELVGSGAEVVIGAHTHDVIAKISKLKRFPRVSKGFEISANTVEVANPLGGAIYIKIPEGTSLGELDVTISGAIKYAYYAQNSINTGDIVDFEARIASAEVLWAEVETDNFMFTGPLAYFKGGDVPEALTAWDKMWEAYQLYNGRPYPRHSAEHVVIDSMSKWNTLAGGNPMVLYWGSAPFVSGIWGDTGTNIMNILDFNHAIQDEKVTYWHEMSHHNGLATLPGELECIVGLAYVVTNHLGLGMSIDDAMRYSERSHLAHL